VSRLFKALNELDARKRLSREISLETDAADSPPDPHRETPSTTQTTPPLSKILPVIMVLAMATAVFWWLPLWPTVPELKQAVSTHIPYLARWFGSPPAQPVASPTIVTAAQPPVSTNPVTAESSPQQPPPQAAITVPQPKPEPTPPLTMAHLAPSETPDIETMLAKKALNFFLPNDDGKHAIPRDHPPGASADDPQGNPSPKVSPPPATAPIPSPPQDSMSSDTRERVGKQRDHSAGTRHQESKENQTDTQTSLTPAKRATPIPTPAPSAEGITLKAEESIQSLRALALARQALASGDIFRADAELAKVDPAMHEESDYLGTLAALESRRGAAHRAIGLYQQLTLREPLLSQWWLGLAIAHDRMNHGADALRAYRRALHDTHLTNDAVDFILGRITLLERYNH